METTVSREFLYVQEQLGSGMIGRIQFLRGAHLQEMSGWPGYWEGLLPMHYATHAISPCSPSRGALAEYVVCFAHARASSSPTPMCTSCLRGSPGRPRCGRTPCVRNASRSFRAGRRRAGGPRVPQQRADTDLQLTTAEIDLVPYAWSNRGRSTMRVWIPLSEGARYQSPRTRPSRSRPTDALDQTVPKSRCSTAVAARVQWDGSAGRAVNPASTMTPDQPCSRN